ncbi:MAG TPA: peptidase S10 [Caulobacteraceae bacterium]|jgi:carboxypeptidase C (cathepsin A)|nr:peptidase S10 [Caulobacteraceae bacterium]
MRSVFRAVAMAAVLAFAGGVAAHAEDSGKDKPATETKKDADIGDFTPFPADAHVAQVTHVAGKTLNYTVTVGSLPVRDEKGKKIAEVVFTAYILDGHKADPTTRPVTFAFNGGPGAASVYLNLGAIGPKRVPFGISGEYASDSPQLQDNPGTWLDFTDLVFIDPVGTGFSRSLLPLDQTKKKFWATQPDIEYLSRIVYDWLLKNERMASPKYLVGESYGGYRGPRLAHYLQTQLGVGINGVTLVSPYLDASSTGDGSLSPIPWAVNLPSMSAAYLERQGKVPNPETMAAVEAYARGEYITDLLKGARDQAAVDRIVQHVTAFTGLDPSFVKRDAGRLDTGDFLRGVYRDQGMLGSVYDSTVTAYDPFPWSPQQRASDPLLDSIIAPTTSAMVDFVTRTVGWKVDGRYEALSFQVGRNWEGGIGNVEAVTDLRQAVALDPKLKVLIVHGYNDLSCPYFASELIVDQMPAMGDPGRVQVHVYPGGHMFYSRPGSQSALRHDVMTLYGAA